MAAIPEERELLDSDETLAQRVGAGDAAAFEELYRRYARPLAAFGARLLSDRSAGEDVAQTSLMNAYRSMRGGTRPRHLRPWLYRIAQNAAYEARRRRHGEVVNSELLEAERQWSDDAAFDREAWLDGLRALPRRQRDVYVLRELNGLRVSEVADRLELTSTQVEQALFAARNALAERLVFGGRVTCVALQEAASDGSLAFVRRRAIKAHADSCASCRGSLPARLLGVLGNFGLALRQLPQWLAGGGAAPVAAKLGALAVTGVISAAAAPSAYHAVAAIIRHNAQPPAETASIPDAAVPLSVLASWTGASAAPLVATLAPAFLQPPVARLAVPGAPGALPASPPTDTTTTDTTATATDASPADAAPADTASTDPAASDPTATDTTATDTTATDTTATDTTATDTTATDTTATDTTATDTTATDTTPTDTTPLSAPGG
ncbi:MAG TPA: RNA polymerase sigma factor [Gaiellaceae bacterium]|nr:RNA polymerase sigma factor [Gaiellaceae bacterium]